MVVETIYKNQSKSKSSDVFMTVLNKMSVNMRYILILNLTSTDFKISYDITFYFL